MNPSDSPFEAMKEKLYKTARARISCAYFKQGDFVSVEYASTDEKGTHWFNIRKSQHGELPSVVAYPQHHLAEFCL